MPITEWELRRILSAATPPVGHAPNVPPKELRPEVLKEAVAALARLPAGVEREYYVRWLAQQAGGALPGATGSLESALRAELSRVETRKRSGAQRTSDKLPAAEEEPDRRGDAVAVGRLGRSLLAAFLHQPDLAERFLAELEPEDFSIPEQRSVFVAIAHLVEQGQPAVAQTVLSQVAPEVRPLLAELAVGEVPEERLEEEVRRAIRRLVEGRLRREETALRGRLEAADSDTQRQALLERLSECRRRRSKLAEERIVGEV